MNRNSETARHLVERLADVGTDVTGRQLERWSSERLMPPDGLDEPAKVAHLAELVKVYRPGPGAADRSALVLLARGHACDRAREAIAQRFIGASVEALAASAAAWEVPTFSDPMTDAGSRGAEEIVGILSEVAENGLDVPIGSPVKTLFEAIDAHGPGLPVDRATGSPESADAIRDAAVHQLLALATGQPYVVEALPPNVGGNGDEADEALAERIGAVPAAMRQVFMMLPTLPLDVLRTGAATARAILPFTSGQADDEKRDEMAGAWAVVGIVLAGLSASLGAGVELAAPGVQAR